MWERRAHSHHRAARTQWSSQALPSNRSRFHSRCFAALRGEQTLFKLGRLFPGPEELSPLPGCLTPSPYGWWYSVFSSPTCPRRGAPFPQGDGAGERAPSGCQSGPLGVVALLRLASRNLTTTFNPVSSPSHGAGNQPREQSQHIFWRRRAQGKDEETLGLDPAVTCSVDLSSFIQKYFLRTYYVPNAVLGSYNHLQTDITLPSWKSWPVEEAKNK